MQRLASTIGLGAWLGYSAGQAFLLGAHALGFEAEAVSHSIAGLDLELPDIAAVDGGEASVGAGLLLAAALALCTAIGRLHSLSADRRMDGEGLAGAALCALLAFYGSAALTGSGLAAVLAGSAGFTLALAAIFAALLFDHMMDDGRIQESDQAYEAALALIRNAPRIEHRDSRRESVREEMER